jgi:hypothetical protein
VADPNIGPKIRKLYSKFEIVVMWGNDFVHMCKVLKF